MDQIRIEQVAAKLPDKLDVAMAAVRASVAEFREMYGRQDSGEVSIAAAERMEAELDAAARRRSLTERPDVAHAGDRAARAHGDVWPVSPSSAQGGDRGSTP